MKRIVLISSILVGFLAQKTFGQVTHAVSFQLGLNQTLYWSQESTSKSYSSHFLPSFAIDYAKYSENVFWGGIGYGFSPRYVPFYKYNTNAKVGIRYPEFWFRVRTGLKLQGDFITHLPHLSLGIGINGGIEDFTDNGFNNTMTYSLQDSTRGLKRYSPFAELSNTIINSTFREGKRNVFMTFGVRFYPIDMFDAAVNYEYDTGLFQPVQYRLIEIFLSAGLQRNFQR
jgi:hypothetical protein